MAHNLATTNGRTAMFYTGETPWHRLGTKLDNPATASEAIVAAGLDYTVEKQPLFTADGEVAPRQAVVRADTREVLGVVGRGYMPIQNHAAFEFLDSVVLSNELRYHTAGALHRGEKIWLLAKLRGEIRVKNSDDISEKFLLLSNSHDGSASLRVFLCPVRVVCANTLNLALSKGQRQGVSIQHRGDLDSKLVEARELLGFAHHIYMDMEQQAEVLASYYPRAEQIENFFKAIYPDPPSGEANRAISARRELTRLLEDGRGQDIPQIRHSMWAAVNAVTEYVDHHRNSRGANTLDRDSRRLDSIWFGTGANLKAKAWSEALTLAS